MRIIVHPSKSAPRPGHIAAIEFPPRETPAAAATLRPGPEIDSSDPIGDVSIVKPERILATGTDSFRNQPEKTARGGA